MREVNVKDLIPIVKKLCIDANFYMGEDVINRIKQMKEKEESPTGKEVLDILLQNYELAAQEKMPICQDTGIAVTFLEIGQDIHLVGGDLYEAINEGVRQGYKEGYLRKSMVDDPIIDRVNTKDNTPAIIYTDIVPGEKIKITIAPKGGGSENMSEVKMMKAADGIEGVVEFVVDRIARSGGNPCPPIVVGVGLGGNFEQSALLAKKALLRDLDEENPDPKWAKVEKEILEKINNLGIGPQGLGGRTTALGVQILTKPCHIASMPVAVNVQCHAARHKSAVI
ncbi:MAG: fumarate hydratase [Candidatus Cloacimonetes bacterium]|nr:fumarate hydratase [Candidatus Cloacimonadota bacterium]MCF7813435.1 fumarate hydratase [Candidatus Cloacimonadota bacterium]MCF7867728.1 fumarate hydratase [Candidatus Cloacimonadota bacterium]MCF7883186.1 fumarate hydratase [Candidatus Cloacimonadota bacterium]